jgi:peptide/nickel transport system permease protein
LDTRLLPFRRLGQSALVIAAMATLVFVWVCAIGNPMDIFISPEADKNYAYV